MQYRVKATCPVCSKERTVAYSKKGDIIRKCKECSQPKTIGKKLIDANGYVRVQTHDGWMYEHRLVWEKHHNKKIPKGFAIHHLNEVKTDNRIENLQMLDKRSHDSVSFYSLWDKRREGLVPPRKVPHQKNFEKDILIELLNEHKSLRKTARILGVGRGCLNRNLRDNNIVYNTKTKKVISP